ncbi:hypothetical protein GFS60_06213 (plasmid) [Rhodococcus sp. WAY2]|nr:hypothetical protein GFS60_06213 [Rhodococcus sp. WAY2]
MGDVSSTSQLWVGVIRDMLTITGVAKVVVDECDASAPAA